MNPIHYHVIPTLSATPLSNLKIANYEEAIVEFVGLAVQLFKDGNEAGYTLEDALQATEYGQGEGAFVGVEEHLGLYFIACNTSCASSTWN